jgi:multisubunit Na+/H+ antiporter MnhB subunit
MKDEQLDTVATIIAALLLILAAYSLAILFTVAGGTFTQGLVFGFGSVIILGQVMDR